MFRIFPHFPIDTPQPGWHPSSAPPQSAATHHSVSTAAQTGFPSAGRRRYRRPVPQLTLQGDLSQEHFGVTG